ncbi:MAG: glycine cleavage system aminomethyltransferase GcvT [Verrucomicrobiales bacterium]
MKHSPLEPVHLRLGGRMVPFGGWSMPLQFSSITEEHHAVRRGVGVFDISHMGEFVVSGPKAEAALDALLTNNVARLGVGDGQYTLLLNDEGGVIDDLIIYRTGPDHFFLVVNASTTEEDERWLREKLSGEAVVENRSAAWAAMAVQGPGAAELLDPLPSRNGVRVDGPVIICRTGYTGEDGFELFCHPEAAVKWFERFVAAGAKPCGLGARDTLRLEMGFPLNGSDLTPDRTPLESALGFFVDFSKPHFIGREILMAQKLSKGHDRLCALQMNDKGPPPRAHYAVFSKGVKLGEVTSGGVAPSLDGAGIALAYLPAAFSKIGTPVEIDVRGRLLPARVVKKPFYTEKNRSPQSPVPS